MNISKEKLNRVAESTGFRPEVLEKVVYLLTLLEGFRDHPFLKCRLALKGSTALNLFTFDLPRLTVDFDLNYIGAAERKVMLAERPSVEKAIKAVCEREGLAVRHIPTDHAGGRWSLRYQSALGQGSNLEIDLNFMFRIPLWPVVAQDSRPVGSYMARQIPVVDIHELAAGKLAALLARHGSRDLFDTHQLLTSSNLDRERLRLAIVVYGAMNRKDWRTVSTSDVSFETNELENSLLPLLRRDFLAGLDQNTAWATRLVEECHQALEIVLPLSKAEIKFLDRLLDEGKIIPSLLTENDSLAERIACHPGLEWKAHNVRRHKEK
jgi:predicted nucleotidyltransferase component of viral defense system